MLPPASYGVEVVVVVDGGSQEVGELVVSRRAGILGENAGGADSVWDFCVFLIAATGVWQITNASANGGTEMASVGSHPSKLRLVQLLKPGSWAGRCEWREVDVPGRVG